MARISFHIPELTCDGCAQAIRDELGAVSSIEQVDIDVKKKQVSVEYDPDQITSEAVREQLNQAGFPPDKQLLALQPSKAQREQTPEKEPPQPSSSLWYWLLAVGVTILGLAGYLGYELYPRFDLPAAEGSALLLLSAAAGIASFFSPCAFPLLVTLLARESGIQAKEASRSTAAPLLFASALSIGTAVFLLLSGIIIASGGGALFAGVTFTSTAGQTIRVVVGVLLIALGLIQLGLFPNPLHAVEKISRPLRRSQARYRRRSPVLGFTLFGFRLPDCGVWLNGSNPGRSGRAFVYRGRIRGFIDRFYCRRRCDRPTDVRAFLGRGNSPGGSGRHAACPCRASEALGRLGSYTGRALAHFSDSFCRILRRDISSLMKMV